MKPLECICVKGQAAGCFPQVPDVYEIILPAYVELLSGKKERGEWKIYGKTLKTSIPLVFHKEALEDIKFVVTTNTVAHFYNVYTPAVRLETYERDKTLSRITEARDDDGQWLTREDFNTYNAFIETWKPEYIETVAEYSLVCEISEVVLDTNNTWIKSNWNYESVPAQAKLYTYHRHKAQMDTFLALMKEYDMSYDVPNHSHLQYARIEGTYAFSDKWWDEKKNALLKGTLEALKAAYEADVTEITGIVAVHVAKKYGTAGQVDWVAILDELKKLKCGVGNIESKQKTQGAKNNCLANISILISVIENSVCGKSVSNIK